MKKMYYLEFVHINEEENYTIQSKWFKSKAQALKAYRTFFDYVSEDMSVFIMAADIDVEGIYDNIKIEERIK